MKQLSSQFAVAALLAAAFLPDSSASAGILSFQPIRMPDRDASPVVEIGLRARGQPAIARGNYVYQGGRYNGAGQYLGPARSAKAAGGFGGAVSSGPKTKMFGVDRVASTTRRKCTAGSCVRPNVSSGPGRQEASSRSAGTAAVLATPAVNSTDVPLLAPPRTISDIKAILDGEKPDPAGIEKQLQIVGAEPPRNGSPGELAKFYHDRSNALRALARVREAIAASELAVKYSAKEQTATSFQYKRVLALTYLTVVDRRALDIWLEMAREAENPANRLQGYLFQLYRLIAMSYVGRGNIAQAELYLNRNIKLMRTARASPGWAPYFKAHGANWESDLENTKALVLEARGRYAEAEAAYRKAEALRWQSLKDSEQIPIEKRAPAQDYVRDANLLIGAQSRMLVRQGKLTDAEVMARRALMGALKSDGKYYPSVPAYVAWLGSVMASQGRHAEAETLVRTALDIHRELGMADDDVRRVRLLNQLAWTYLLANRQKEVSEVTAQIEAATANWDPRERQLYLSNELRIDVLYAAGRIDEGIAIAQDLVKRMAAQYGARDFSTATARAALATGYVRSGREAEALRELTSALPVLVDAARNSVRDENAVVTRDIRLLDAAETYFGILAGQNAGTSNSNVVSETLRFSDSLDGRSVQRAMAASSLRAMAGSNAALAKLMRAEQDFSNQLSAQVAALNNLLSLPSDQRSEADLKSVGASIDRLRIEQQKAREEIAKRLPLFAELVNPRPPTNEQIGAALKQGETFLSFYFGRSRSFVWAIPKDGAATFTEIKVTRAQLEEKIAKLRGSLDPQGTMISDIPPFDLDLGHELYALLLKQIEPTWKSSRSLIVATNGTLALMPLSLLPTAPVDPGNDGDMLFSSYRKVPWLARTHAVSMVPSAAAFTTLRQLPPGKPERDELIAFGDPLFSAEQAATSGGIEVRTEIAAAGDAMRGLPLKRRASAQLNGIDSAELGLLPRLPDTAEELRSMAVALHADPSKALHLGKDANEQAVKTMDLTGFKVVAFATHGLVPGELTGLTQPALALSAPAISGGEGDGLLTMEEILSLRLDADWVVLSACNTAAGLDAGMEAASGLGRAFFYAGTRAILVTNWSVHSQSARVLIGDLFERQTQDSKLSRGEALREAMMALVDGAGYVGAGGKTEFAYAHPLFWAPYSIIGDGGVR